MGRIRKYLWIIRAAYHLGQYASGWNWKGRLSYAESLWNSYFDWSPEDAVLKDVSYWYE